MRILESGKIEETRKPAWFYSGVIEILNEDGEVLQVIPISNDSLFPISNFFYPARTFQFAIEYMLNEPIEISNFQQGERWKIEFETVNTGKKGIAIFEIFIERYMLYEAIFALLVKSVNDIYADDEDSKKVIINKLLEIKSFLETGERIKKFKFANKTPALLVQGQKFSSIGQYFRIYETLPGSMVVFVNNIKRESNLPFEEFYETLEAIEYKFIPLNPSEMLALVQPVNKLQIATKGVIYKLVFTSNGYEITKIDNDIIDLFRLKYFTKFLSVYHSMVKNRDEVNKMLKVLKRINDKNLAKKIEEMVKEITNLRARLTEKEAKIRELLRWKENESDVWKAKYELLRNKMYKLQKQYRKWKRKSLILDRLVNALESISDELNIDLNKPEEEVVKDIIRVLRRVKREQIRAENAVKQRKALKRNQSNEFRVKEEKPKKAVKKEKQSKPIDFLRVAELLTDAIKMDGRNLGRKQINQFLTASFMEMSKYIRSIKIASPALILYTIAGLQLQVKPQFLVEAITKNPDLALKAGIREAEEKEGLEERIKEKIEEIEDLYYTL